MAKRRATRQPEYKCWAAMVSRCTNPNDSDFDLYGARGIKVHPDWTGPGGFEIFLAEVGRRPSSKHSLDRRNNEGHYYPGNVRWADQKTQARNTRRNTTLTYRGHTATLAEWSERTGLTTQSIQYRIKKGWSVEETLTIPPGCRDSDIRIDPFDPEVAAQVEARRRRLKSKNQLPTGRPRKHATDEDRRAEARRRRRARRKRGLPR